METTEEVAVRLWRGTCCVQLNLPIRPQGLSRYLCHFGQVAFLLNTNRINLANVTSQSDILFEDLTESMSLWKELHKLYHILCSQSAPNL